MDDHRHILIVTALPFEGACIKRNLGLRQISSPLSEFALGPWHLAVSGTGKARCAAATGALCIRFAPDDIAAVVNIGIAGAVSHNDKVGDTYVISRIDDAAKSRSFYPDLLARHNMPEAMVTTYDKPVTERSTAAPPSGLVDMEASAFFEAASLFVGPEKIVCLKMISDILLQDSKIDKAQTAARLEAKIPEMVEYIERVCECTGRSKVIPLTDGHHRYMEALSTTLQLTRTQQEQLLQSVTRFVQKHPAASLPEFIPARVTTARERNQYFVQFQKELLR